MTTSSDKNDGGLHVLAHGKGWLGVEKPAGISIHNDPGADLCSRVVQYCRQHPRFIDERHADPGFGFHPVHRLDRQTSGIVLVAYNRDTFRFLSEQFDSRAVKKTYTALLHGSLVGPADTRTWGKWTWPLSKRPGGRRNPAGSGRRLPCETRFYPLAHSARYTLVEIMPLTGRKHQIRRHASLAGHAVVGDSRYGTPRAAQYLHRRFGFDRLALHARAISLQTPDSDTPITVRTPALPAEMRSLLNRDETTPPKDGQ